jgi:hypothetical protein
VVEFFFSAFAGVTILLLQQADIYFSIAACWFQLVLGKFPSPHFDLAAHFLLLTFKIILIHLILPNHLRYAAPVYAGARDSLVRRLFRLYLPHETAKALAENLM